MLAQIKPSPVHDADRSNRLMLAVEHSETIKAKIHALYDAHPGGIHLWPRELREQLHTLQDDLKTANHKMLDELYAD